MGHINYALVEDTRPQRYSSMKYWGKKPHNIWRQYIENYTDKGEIVLDPFCGSAISAFEAVKVNRKAYAFDLNPLSSFFIESLTTKFDEEKFKSAFKEIKNEILTDKIYKKHYTKKMDEKICTIYNFKWKGDYIDRLAIKCNNESIIEKPDIIDNKNAVNQNKIDVPFWFPDKEFPNNPSITQKFINDIGGNSFKYLWTRRNLYLLAKIFSKIQSLNNEQVKLQLLSGFIQTLHLCSKMVVYRSPKSNREFSGSWGRADYMIRNKSMEQNPLIVFERSCFGRQSVESAMLDMKKNFTEGISINDVSQTNEIKESADINYGAIDVADLGQYLSNKSIDFIITDPPYAGLVYYLDLSFIWLSWLRKYDEKYNPDLRSEITIKENYIERDEYRIKLRNAFKLMHNVLKDNRYLVVTFHHKKIQEWNDFVKSVRLAGFKFDKVTHQYNRRSGESNVANPYGTSGADFYIRCAKQRDVDFTDDQSGLEHFVKRKAIEIIALRNEPTPYTILVSGLIPEMLQAGFFRPQDYKKEIKNILKRYAGEGNVFLVKENHDNGAGEYWWFQNPEDHINYPDLPLQERVEEVVLQFLRSEVSVKFDDVVAKLFKTFPNGLTPDPRGIRDILEKYAFRSSSRWKLKEEVKQQIKVHSKKISELTDIGKKLGYETYVGKREQFESLSKGERLRDKSDYSNLNELEYDENKRKRVEMIDCIWINEGRIKVALEVENSTDFLSAITRGSNLNKGIPKYMVIPDEREDELVNISDPLFKKEFKEHNWRYILYSNIDRLVKARSITHSDLLSNSKKLRQ